MGWENDRVLLMPTTIIGVPKMVLLPTSCRKACVLCSVSLTPVLRHFDSSSPISKGSESMSEPMSEANAYMHELESGPVPGMVYTTSELPVEVLSDR